MSRSGSCLGLFFAVCLAQAACGGSSGSPPAAELPPSSNAALESLTLSQGTLTPAFEPAILAYSVGPALLDPSVAVTPVSADPAATIEVAGVVVASGTSSPAVTLPGGITPVDVTVTAADGVTVRSYVLTFVRGIGQQEAYVKASNSRAAAGFGISVALSGDTLVVGAPGESSQASGVDGDSADTSAPGSGAAYVFTRSGASWVQQAYLKASNPDAGDGFGRSVAIDGETIVVGADQERSSATGVGGDQDDDSAPGSGAAYVFVREGTTWSQQAYVKAPDSHALDFFGGSVAISGDTLVVGASRHDTSQGNLPGRGEDAGAAYVFVRAGTAWSPQALLKPFDLGDFDCFGASVAIAGDTVVIGATEPGGLSTGIFNTFFPAGTGAVYVYVRTGTTWELAQDRLVASDPDVQDGFGCSVALSGDTFLVGASEEASGATGVNGDGSDDSAAGAGAAYVFVRTGATWAQQAYLKATNTGSGDRFGLCVALFGDVAVVGAHGENGTSPGVNGDPSVEGAGRSGAAYVFLRSNETWAPQAYLKASNPDANDQVGIAVALSEDRIVLGAVGEDSAAVGIDGDQEDESATNSGAAYVFR